MSKLFEDEDDETVNDALKTTTSWSHIYLDSRLHPHRPLRDFGARKFIHHVCSRAEERSHVGDG